MFTLTATIWILVNGVGDPVNGGMIRHDDTFATRTECEAKGEEDRTKLAQIIANGIAKSGKQDTVKDVVMTCKVAGQEI